MARMTAKSLAAAPSGVSVRLGVVTQAPATAAGQVGVAYASRPDHTVAITDDWNRNGLTLPAEGSRCVLLCSPGLNPVVVTWSPNA